MLCLGVLKLFFFFSLLCCSMLCFSSHTYMDCTALLDPNPNHPFLVDQATLTMIVRDKSLQILRNRGGVQGVASALKTSVEHGIFRDDPNDIARRREVFGSNTYPKPPPKSFLHFVVEAFKDSTILILLACAVLSLGIGIKEHGLQEGWYDGGSIFLAVFIVIGVSSISSFRQNRQFDKLSQVRNDIQIAVVRSGRPQQISKSKIVAGDVIYLKTGDQVPADGLFVDGHSLQVDESSMRRRSDHVEVNGCHHVEESSMRRQSDIVEVSGSLPPFLLSGTKVVNGYAKMLVTSVGMNTTWGQMMSSISRNNYEQTPLQARLNKLTSSIRNVSLAVALLVLVVSLILYFTGQTTDENGYKEFNGSKTKFEDIVNAVVNMLAATVTIVVAAIPEGLPLVATLTLAYSVKKMMADEAMVRKLSACETMAYATTICTDKTGVLTLNRMEVTMFWLGQQPVAKGAYTLIAPNVLRLIREAAALNTTGSVLDSGFKFLRSPTEKAILSWAVNNLNMEMEQVTQNCTIIQVESFNSENKQNKVVITRKADNTIHEHRKGAAEMVLQMCSRYYDASGAVRDLGNTNRMAFKNIIEGMATRSLRCIAFAHTEVAGEGDRNVNKDGLILLGLMGISNPCRPGVRNDVEACLRATVSIKMITGDNIFTAKAIATECGILPLNENIDGAVVEGEEFRNYTPEERLEKVDKICVMARSSPFDKLLMVQCLKQKGHVVAVTGDGTNDAPALKEADIGLSMGIQGTEVAKESSDIVILDDNFASIARVLRWGRCVHNNIQKFIQFQLTMNVAALAINFVVAVPTRKIPLRAVQLLWVNLIMDTLGALALASEKPTMELMDKPPIGSTEPLINNVMWRNLLAQALYQTAVLLTLQFKGEAIFNVASNVKDTMIFNTFVLCQIFNKFNARKLEKRNIFAGIHRNKLFLGIILMTIVLHGVMVEFLMKFADTETLNWGQWGTCIIISGLQLFVRLLVGL